jgi:hypothetical protein
MKKNIEYDNICKIHNKYTQICKKPNDLHILKTHLYDIYEKLKSYYKNYILISSNNFSSLNEEGYFVNILSVKTWKYNIFEIEHLYKYTIIANFIYIEKITRTYTFENNYKFNRSTDSEEDFYDFDGVFCMNCKKISAHKVIHRKNDYKPMYKLPFINYAKCQANSTLLGSSHGKMFKCPCGNEYFYDISTTGTFTYFDVKKALIEKYNKKHEPFPVFNFLFFSNIFKCDMYKSKLFKKYFVCLLLKNYKKEKNEYMLRSTTKKNFVLEKRKKYSFDFTHLDQKYNLSHAKIQYGKYKNKFLIDVYHEDPYYIQYLISHNWFFDDAKDEYFFGNYQHKKIRALVPKLFRFMLNLPKYPCDEPNCKRIALYGEEEKFPYRCMIHKKEYQEKVLGASYSSQCQGINGICPYDCKRGRIEYDNYCSYCFAHLFPYDERVQHIKIKSTEIKIINHICLKHDGVWYHDKPLYFDFDGGCCISKRKIDMRQMIHGTMLCIEVDENQHKSYCKYDDFVRYNELVCDLTCKYIFIRFNPDKYKNNRSIRNPSLKYRLQQLDKEIYLQIKRINDNKNEDLLEIIYMFYDK